MKLIRTKLLLNHRFDSASAIATASHTDYCKFKFNNLKSDLGSLFSEFIESFIKFVCLSVVVIFTPIIMLTNGLILYPFWTIAHIRRVKRIVKRYGVEDLNKSAEKLVKDFNEE